ncbi:MAG: hypothetical protein M1607_04190 [Patescibacteria group bacterium]|nr:hypothetical protein [Patescibacteria group bacterium]
MDTILTEIYHSYFFTILINSLNIGFYIGLIGLVLSLFVKKVRLLRRLFIALLIIYFILLASVLFIFSRYNPNICCALP